MMADTYDHTHRAMLQALMARSTMTFAEARPVLAAILSVSDNRDIQPNDISLADFNSYISTLNSALEPLDYEIRSTMHQNPPPADRTPSNGTSSTASTSSERIWALVNTTSDPLTQLATTMSPDDIGFVKRVLDAMFIANNRPRAEVMAVTSLEALKLAKAPRSRDSGVVNGNAETQQTQGSGGAGLTLARAEEVLGGLVEEGWFEKSRAGYYSLSPRALMELRGWLIETYNEEGEEEEEEGERWERIKFCEACRDLVTIGQRCADINCNCRFHNMCVRSFFRNQPAQKCPKCDTEWNEDPVGEKAARRGGRPSSATVAASTRTTVDVVDDEEEEEDEED